MWLAQPVWDGIGSILIGILLGVALFFYWLAMTIIAGIKASEGVRYRYPFSLRLIK